MHLQIECKASYDGTAALAELASWPVDMVFLDLLMPGMDGFETAAAMHEMPGNALLPIVAMSGWDGGADQSQWKNAGFVARIQKPVQLNILLDAVERFWRPAIAATAGAARPGGNRQG